LRDKKVYRSCFLQSSTKSTQVESFGA